METTVLLSRLRTALVHLIAACWFSGELCWQAGYRFGVWLHGLNAALAVRAAIAAHAAQAAAAPSPEAAMEPAPVSASSSSGIIPLCPGAWWDLIDPSEAAEADGELPLRWAV